MTIENYPLWPFEPNWENDVTETLEWLTSILQSPTGAEQRRALRQFPRRAIDFSVLVGTYERAYMDTLLAAYSARTWYLPLFYDVNMLSSFALAGSTTLALDDPTTSRLESGAAVIMGETVFDVEIIDIASVTGTGVTLNAPTVSFWAAHSRVFMLKPARLASQLTLSKQSDAVVSGTAKFMIDEQRPETTVLPIDAGAFLDTTPYLGFPVLGDEPDETSNIDLSGERLLVTIDNKMGVPYQVDTANRFFTTTVYNWIISGRTAHWQLEGFLNTVMGQRGAFWAPTWMNDFNLTANAAASDTLLTVGRAGFVDAGGPEGDREHIMIQMIDGSRIYRRVTDAVISGTNEILSLDAPLGVAITPPSVLRICFIALMRLNQDGIGIVHKTDNHGVSMVSANLRSAPDLRVATSGF